MMCNHWPKIFLIFFYFIRKFKIIEIYALDTYVPKINAFIDPIMPRVICLKLCTVSISHGNLKRGTVKLGKINAHQVCLKVRNASFEQI